MSEPATYTITGVRQNDEGTGPAIRAWNSGQGGPMRGYRIKLRNAAGAELDGVEWSRKADSNAPTVGQEVTGTVDTSGQYGPKFKMAAQGGGGGGRGGGGGGGRPRDPAERRSIAMQHAQKCAVTILEVAAAHGDYNPPNAADVVEQVKTVAAKLWLQVQEAENDQIPNPNNGGSQ